jgi:hypothetical protein
VSLGGGLEASFNLPLTPEAAKYLEGLSSPQERATIQKKSEEVLNLIRQRDLQRATT